jgi:hypothetical protein
MELLIGMPLEAWMNVTNFSFFGLFHLSTGLAQGSPPYKESQPTLHKKILNPEKILNPTPHREEGGSVVSIVTMLRAGQSGIQKLSGKKIFLLSKTSTLALRSTQPSTQSVL